LRSNISEHTITINDLERNIGVLRQELNNRFGGVRQVELECEKKLKKVENELYNKDYNIQQKDSKIKSNDQLIGNLTKQMKEYESEILRLMKENKDAAFNKQNSAKLEKIAHTMDQERAKLNNELVTLKQTNNQALGKQHQLQGQQNSLQAELEQMKSNDS